MAITVKDYLFGPVASLTVGGVEWGGYEGSAKLTITEELQEPDLTNAGKVKGLSRVNRIMAKIAVQLGETSMAKLQWALHNASLTVGTAAVTGGGLATTLAADAAAGATSVVITSATGMADDLYFKAGDTGETEIVHVDPSWASGTTIPLTTPLIRAHDAGDAFVQVDDAGTTILRQRTGRISTAQHKNVVMQAIDPAGDAYLVTLFDCLNTAGLDQEFGESGSAGTPIVFEAYTDPADPTLAPYAIERLSV